MPLIPQSADDKMVNLSKKLQRVEVKSSIGNSRLSHDMKAESYQEKEYSSSEDREEEKVSQKTYSGMGSGLLRQFM